MATIKSYTDLEQSKKLANILPLESADMHYNNASIKGINYVDEYRAELMDYNTAQKVLSKYLINPIFGIIPCCSLSALLGVLQNYEINNFGDSIQLAVKNKAIVTDEGETLLDLVVNMIIYLHELNLL